MQITNTLKLPVIAGLKKVNMSNNALSKVSKVWSFCNPLRDVGVGYGDGILRRILCDKIEQTISLSLQQAETLRQSILKKAFEGKLVLPNLKDEFGDKEFKIMNNKMPKASNHNRKNNTNKNTTP